MRDLIMAYECTSDRELMLTELIIPLSGGKTRRLGPVISRRIHQYLYGHVNETGVDVNTSACSPSPTKKITIKLKLKN